MKQRVFEIVEIFPNDPYFPIKEFLIGRTGKFTFCNPNRYGEVKSEGVNLFRTAFAFEKPFHFPKGKELEKYKFPVWTWYIDFIHIKVMDGEIKNFIRENEEIKNQKDSFRLIELANWKNKSV